jgi:hypothetical protein
MVTVLGGHQRSIRIAIRGQNIPNGTSSLRVFEYRKRFLSFFWFLFRSFLKSNGNVFISNIIICVFDIFDCCSNNVREWGGCVTSLFAVTRSCVGCHDSSILSIIIQPKQDTSVKLIRQDASVNKTPYKCEQETIQVWTRDDTSVNKPGYKSSVNKTGYECE